jgi:hypothetical protein
MKEPDLLHGKKLEEARALYMQYKPVLEIAKALDIPAVTIWWNAREKGWAKERSSQTDELIKDIAETSKEQLSKLWAIGLPLIVRSVMSAAAKNNNTLSIKESKELSEIMINFQKLQSVNMEDAESRLSSTKTPHLTIREIKQIFLSDKFLDIEMREVSGNSGESTKRDARELGEKPRDLATGHIGPFEALNRDSGNAGTTDGSTPKPDAKNRGTGTEDPFTS